MPHGSKGREGPHLDDLPEILETTRAIAFIETANRDFLRHWKMADLERSLAATLVGTYRMEWQVSLSATLRMWVLADRALTSGEIILAWMNLGSLVEGSIKFLIAANHKKYRHELVELLHADHPSLSGSTHELVDYLSLAPLRKICKTHSILDPDDFDLLDLVQRRRKSIQAVKERLIGDDAELWGAIRAYFRMLQSIHRKLP